MGYKVSGDGCSIGVLRFNLLMLVSPMGWSLGYTSSSCSEKIRMVVVLMFLNIYVLWWCLEMIYGECLLLDFEVRL